MQVSRGRKPSPPLITAKQIALNAKRLNDTVAKYNGNIVMAQNEIQDAVTQTGLEALAMGLLADTERGEQRGNRALLSGHVSEMGKGSALEKEIGRDALSLGKTVTEASLGLNVLGSFMGTIANVWQANKPDPSKAVDLSKVLSADAKKLMAGPRDQRKIAEAGALEAVSKNLKILEKGTKGLGLSEYESPNLSAGGGVPRARAKAEEVDSDWLHIDKPGDFKWTPESPSIGGDRTLKAPEFPTKDFSNDPVYDPSELISDEAAAKFSGTDFNEYNNMGTLDVRGTGEQGESIDPGINLPRVTGALDEHNLQAEQLDKSLDPVMGALERGEGQRSSRIPDADTLRRGAPRDPLPLPSARDPLGEELIDPGTNLPRMDAEQPDLRLAREDHDRKMVDALTRLNTPFERGEGQRSSRIPDADTLRRGAPRDPLPLPDARAPLGEEPIEADVSLPRMDAGKADLRLAYEDRDKELLKALNTINSAFSGAGGPGPSSIPDADTLRRGAPRDPLPLPDARAPLGENEMGADILRHTDTIDEHNLQAQKLDDALAVVEGARGPGPSRIPDADTLRRGAPREMERLQPRTSQGAEPIEADVRFSGMPQQEPPEMGLRSQSERVTPEAIAPVPEPSEELGMQAVPQPAPQPAPPVEEEEGYDPTDLVEVETRSGTPALLPRKFANRWVRFTEFARSKGVNLQITDELSGARTSEQISQMQANRPNATIATRGFHTAHKGNKAVDITVGGTFDSDQYRFLAEYGPAWGIVPGHTLPGQPGTYKEPHHWLFQDSMPVDSPYRLSNAQSAPPLQSSENQEMTRWVEGVNRGELDSTIRNLSSGRR